MRTIIVTLVAAVCLLMVMSTGSPAETDYAYPRGGDIAYGMMSCDVPSPTNPCVEAGYTAQMTSFASVLSVEDQIEWLRTAKDGGILNRFLVSTPHDGPTGHSSYADYFADLKQQAIDAGIGTDWLGLHHRDEADSVALTQEIYDAYKTLFPGHITVFYGQDENHANDWQDVTDVALFSAYTRYKGRPHAWTFFNLALHASDDYNLDNDSWLEHGKTVWLTTEFFDDTWGGTGGACSLPDAAQRMKSQIFLGALGGAQGIYGYAGVYGHSGSCATSIAPATEEMMPVWQSLAPWIHRGDRQAIPVAVLSGPAEACSGPELEYDICDTAVVARSMRDASGNEVLLVGSLLDSGTGNVVSIPGDWDFWQGEGVSGSTDSLTVEPYGWTVFTGGSAPTPGPTLEPTPTPTVNPAPTPTQTPEPKSAVNCKVRVNIDGKRQWMRCEVFFERFMPQ